MFARQRRPSTRGKGAFCEHAMIFDSILSRRSGYSNNSIIAKKRIEQLGCGVRDESGAVQSAFGDSTLWEEMNETEGVRRY